jgi:hypothetical protein
MRSASGQKYIAVIATAEGAAASAPSSNAVEYLPPAAKLSRTSKKRPKRQG